MNVQKNFFTWEELTTTDTGLFNDPTSPLHLVNLAKLWVYLNSVREKLGQPIYVNSAFRTPQVNEQVRGAKCSYHMEGLAADIKTSASYMSELARILLSDYNNGKLSEYVSHYPVYIHIAIR